MAFAIALYVIAGHGQEALLIFFQNEAGQASRGIRGSINPNAIGTNLRSDARRVTVHNNFAMLRCTRQKRLANTQKIFATLALEVQARPHPGMTEEIIADDR